MGDMADWVNDCSPIDDGLYDYGGKKACRNCDEGSLHWEAPDGRWLLFTEAGHLHKCPIRPLEVDPLEKGK